MAFRILEQDELDILDDEQRKQYERELKLYQQRTAFVEHLEMLENAMIEPYEPKLVSISVISEPDVKPYRKVEYVISLCEPVQRPDLQVVTFNKTEQVAPVLPHLERVNGVWERQINKVEKSKPDLPLIEKAEMLVTPFKWWVNPQADVPVVVSPSIEISAMHKQMKDNLQYTLCNMPDIQKPEMEDIPIMASVKVKPSLPDVAVSIVKIITFHKPKKCDTELPIVIEPHIEGNFSGISEPIQPVLPKIPKAGILERKFNRPKQAKPELPIFSKVVVFEKNFESPRKKKPDTAVQSTPHIGVRTFTEIKRGTLRLPGIRIAEVSDAYSRLKELLYMPEEG